jgi:hypothetical protein
MDGDRDADHPEGWVSYSRRHSSCPWPESQVLHQQVSERGSFGPLDNKQAPAGSDLGAWG